MSNLPIPDDSVFLDLLAIRGNGTRFDPEGVLYITIDGDEFPVSAKSLTALDDRGWVEIGDAGVSVTDRGNYWLEKWSLKKYGQAKLKLTTIGDCSWRNATFDDVSQAFYRGREGVDAK